MKPEAEPTFLPRCLVYRNLTNTETTLNPVANLSTAPQVDTILGFYDADAIVVGHHEVAQVMGWYEGRIIGVDVPVPELGGLQGLLWEGGEFFRVLGSGALEPIARP